VIVGCMGGMFVPGFLHDLTGSYKPFLVLSFATTSLNFACFVFLYFAHPIGEPRAYKKLPELSA
jgi:cyanate permease